MTILDTIFGRTPAPVEPVAPAAVPANQGNIPAAPTVQVDPNNPTAPVAAPVAPVVEEVKTDDPLAQYTKLWENEPIKDGEVVKPAAPLTAEQLTTVMSKADFSKAITPEQMTAIEAGGEGASAAFASAMNAVVTQAMVQSTLINNKLTDKAVAEATAAAEAKLPAMLREQATTDHAKTSNPLFSNPAVKTVMEATQAQLLQKFPNATPAEITKMTQDYIVAVGEQFAPKKVDETTASGDTDWSLFT